MATVGEWYHGALSQLMSGNWKTGDALKMILLTSSYTPNLDTNVHYSDVSANEVTGTGYTAGGAALASITDAATAANSWGDVWAASTAYVVGQVVRPTSGNGSVYMCTVAGTSAASAPTFPTTFGATVTDNTATWENVGSSITVFSSATVSWASATISAAYAAVYDSTPGTASTDPLIALVNFGTTVTSTNSTFSVAPDANLGWAYLTLP